MTTQTLETSQAGSGRRQALKILMLDLLPVVPYYTGHLCAAFQRTTAFDVTLASTTYQHDPKFFDSAENLNRTGLLDITYRLINTPVSLRKSCKLIEYLINLLVILVRCLVNRPDILHVQFLPLAEHRLGLELWLLQLLRKRGVKVVHTVHNVLPQGTGEACRAVYSRLYSSADHLICHDVAAASRVVEEFGVSPQSISVIPHGALFADPGYSAAHASRHELGFAPDECIVLWQGIVRPYKGISLLLDAWRNVCERNRDATLVIAGTGEPAVLDAVRRQVSSLGLEDRVRLELRFLSSRELADYYENADILVYPYTDVTTSGALLTGLSHAKPIVASRLPAFERLLRDRENALLVSVGDVEELEECLSELIDSPALRSALGNRLRTCHESLPSWQEIADRTAECYERTATNDASRHATTAGPPQQQSTDSSPSKEPLIAGELKRLGIHSAHYFVGMIACMALGFVSFPIYTRAFSIAEYGAVDFAQRLLLAFSAAGKLGLQNAVLRFYDGKNTPAGVEGRKYFSTLFYGSLTTSVVVAIVFLALFSLFETRRSFEALNGLVSLLAVLVVLRTLGSILCNFLRVQERTTAYNVATVATKALSILVICAMLPVAGATAQTFFTGTVATEAVIITALTIGLIRQCGLPVTAFSGTLFKTAVAFSAPLVVYEIAFAVLASADRVLVRYYLGADALGYYSVAYGLAQTVNDLLLTSLGMAMMPIYVRLWSSEGAAATTSFLKSSLDIYLMGVTGVLAIIAACSHDGVVLLASAKYAGVDHLIPLFLAGLLTFTAHIFLAAGLLLYKRTVLMAEIMLGSAALNIVLNSMLLPVAGLVGGAIASFLSFAACIVAVGIASNRLLPLGLNVTRIPRYLFAGAMAWLAAYPINVEFPVVSLFGKLAIAVTVYVGALCALDSRARGMAAQTYTYIRRVHGTRIAA